MVLKHKSRQHRETKAQSLNFSLTLNIVVFHLSRIDLRDREYYWSHRGHFGTCGDIEVDKLAHNK